MRKFVDSADIELKSESQSFQGSSHDDNLDQNQIEDNIQPNSGVARNTS